MVELTRANVEALVETSKIAAAGVQTLGQEALARTRENLEQVAAQAKTLTEAGSPTEFFQLQGEIARTQFDRMVAESSRFAESMVKLAGEAFQPLSTRAALNAEKINEITA
jgi:phasin family protein